MGVTSWANLNTILQQENRYKDADPELSMALAQLFTEWEEHFTNKLKDAKAVFGKNVVLSWAVSLQRLGMTPHEFLLARERALQTSWYPTSAADFFDLAQQEIMKQYLDSRLAYMKVANNSAEVLADEDDGGVLYETGRRVDFWMIKSQPEKYSWRRWQEIYPIVCREHFLGKRFIVPTSQRIEEDKKPVPESVALAHIEKIKNLLSKDKAKDNPDPISSSPVAQQTPVAQQKGRTLKEMIDQQVIPEF